MPIAGKGKVIVIVPVAAMHDGCEETLAVGIAGMLFTTTFAVLVTLHPSLMAITV